MNAITAHPVIESLRSFLPAANVLVRDEDLRPYECDGLSVYRELPLTVVIPETEEQVASVLRTCRQHGVAVVARGAGTGLSGGARPSRDAVLMSLAKLNRIIEIDPLARTARVGPGVRNLAVSEAAAPLGLYYAPDPSSQIACSIGGNVAENSGGVHCLKYGLTVHNILKLRVALIDGEIIEVGSAALDAPGYDLLALMTGSEGLLGVVTEITLRLLPLPLSKKVLLAAFPTLESAGTAVASVIASSVVPAGLEMMDKAAIRAAEAYVQAGYPVDAEAMLICELDGGREEVEAQFAIVRALLNASGASEVRCAADDAERQRFWLGRKAAFPAVGRLAPDYYCMDGTIPRRELPYVLRRISELAEEFGLAVANVFHAGDGNLHPLILYDAGIPGQLERAEALGGIILELCVEVGGTVTGEHGVGIEKLNQMCVQFTTAEIAAFHAIKHAFDPEGLLNPGKAIPTLNRCAEFGAMHVNARAPKFADLPRF